ncbi:DUF4405 domain-containing protein [Fuscibacter oryzae]|uniref:DUF4405 domain-containing protein n=1 Tax=Fuscibacter oryzae TaxID=2803939 RepID=A0A8J7MR43_9RHOB|nr:DUF4405 domain-containing protein [Fuscibacter oryzae]MBL4929700.1 DUF4405 domain-containing protein [Fuscibacter oryzae]
MSRLFHTYATPLITGLFLVSLISGIALFFHIGPGGFHAMHEWLSMVLIVPFMLHIWKNWRPMTAYLRRAPMGYALVLSLGAALSFLYPTGSPGGAGGPPQFAFAEKALAATPAELAPALHVTTQALTDALAAQGIPAQPDTSLAKLATDAGKTNAQVLAVLNALP